jgi:hypothetical protein
VNRTKREQKETNHSEGGKENETVPPHGDFGVNLHLGQVRVVGLTAAVSLDVLVDLLTVPEGDVGDGRTNGKVSTDGVQHVGGSEPRKTLHFELGFVEEKVIIEDSELIVLGAVLVEEILREEGEVLGIPDVVRVDGAESDAEKNDKSTLNNTKGREKRRTCKS